MSKQLIEGNPENKNIGLIFKNTSITITAYNNVSRDTEGRIVGYGMPIIGTYFKPDTNRSDDFTLVVRVNVMGLDDDENSIFESDIKRLTIQIDMKRCSMSEDEALSTDLSLFEVDLRNHDHYSRFSGMANFVNYTHIIDLKGGVCFNGIDKPRGDYVLFCKIKDTDCPDNTWVVKGMVDFKIV